MEPLKFTFTVEANPDNPSHRAWLDRLVALVRELGESSQETPDVVPPEVRFLTFDEFLRCFRQSSFPSANCSVDGLRMWTHIIAAYRNGHGVTFDGSARDVRLPFYEAVRLKMGDFQGTRSTLPTREKIIALLRNLARQSLQGDVHDAFLQL